MPTMDTTAVDTDTVTDTDTVWDTVDTTDTDTTTARGPLMLNPRLMPMLPLMPITDTTAVDTDTVTDTDITVKLLLKQQIFKSHISSPIIELSIYQTRLPPPPYIHPEKSEKYLD